MSKRRHYRRLAVTVAALPSGAGRCDALVRINQRLCPTDYVRMGPDGSLR
jgi:hypothetical protein